MNIIIIIIILIIVYYYNTTEYFATDIEAVANVASLYNTGNFTVSNISTTQNASVSGDLTVNGAFNLLPKGIIVAWSGTTAPSGWALCDGKTAGVPNLSGRFVLGSGPAGSNNTNQYKGDSDGADAGYGGENYGVGLTGGIQKQTLSVGQMPVHNHSYYQGGFNRGGGNAAGPVGWAGDGNIGTTTGNNGGNASHTNMPPYYVLAYIYKL
jgi:microcystin-dependent protein